MTDTIPATFLLPARPGEPLVITFRHDALRMAVVDRDQFSRTVARGWDRPGIYFLFGPAADDAPGHYSVYVGRAAPGSITSRIRHHISNREGWDRALLITRTTDDGFTSTDVGWLEGRIYQRLMRAADAELLNTTTPGDDTISVWDREALDRVVTLVEGVMRVLGYRPDPVTDDSPSPPVESADTSLDTERLHHALEQIRPGEWASYGDVGRVVGSHPRGLGSHIRSCAGCPAGWRVLNRRGEIAPGFVWTKPEMKGKDPLHVLSEEGLRFDEEGRALSEARVGAEELERRLAQM